MGGEVQPARVFNLDWGHAAQHPSRGDHLFGLRPLARISIRASLACASSPKPGEAARQSWKLDLVPCRAAARSSCFPFRTRRRALDPEAQGLRHLAFAVDDIDAACARLTALGVTVEPIRVDEYTGARFTFFADPDGLPLELYETA